MWWSEADRIALPIALAIIIVITLIVWLLMRNRSEKAKSVIMQIIAGIIVVLEIIKQIVNIVNGYDTWIIPFHFCSLFIFLFPLAQFGSAKIRGIFKPVAFICALSMTVLFYVQPQGILGSSSEKMFQSFNDFHSFYFHHLVVLYTMLSVVLNNYIPKKNDWKKLLITIAIYSVIGIIMAHVLDTNYNNFLTTEIPLLREVKGVFGVVVHSINMGLVITVGTTLLTIGYYWIYFAIKNCRDRKRSLD